LQISKASASILAVDERQSLESLTREEKVASRALAQLKEKEHEFDERRANRAEEFESLNAKRQEVRLLCYFGSTGLISMSVRDKDKPFAN